MMKLTFEEIKDKLNNGAIDRHDFGDEEYTGDNPVTMTTTYGDITGPQLDRLGPALIVHTHSGEGDGHTETVVRWFPDHDVYVQLDGWYSSYDGTDWDQSGYEHVRPVMSTDRIYVPFDSPVQDDVPIKTEERFRPVQGALKAFLSTKPSWDSFNIGGNIYTVKDLVDQIERDTDVGRTFEEMIIKATLNQLVKS